MEKQYRYLMGGEVFGSDKPYIEPCYQTLTDPEGDEYLDDWNNSKVKLNCSEVELDKIKDGLFWTSKDIYNITSITTVKDCKVYFKEVESESQEQLLSELAECILANKNGLCSTPTILKQFTITRK